MGVAGGRFFPLPAYEAIRPLLLAARNPIQAHLALSVRTADGHAIPAEGGVQMNDYSTELGPESIEIEVMGIGYSLYEKLFPARHEAYVEWFRRNRNVRVAGNSARARIYDSPRLYDSPRFPFGSRQDGAPCSEH